MKLREWRIKNGWTQERVACALGENGGVNSQATVSGWENGSRFPGPATIIEIFKLTEGEVRPDDWYDLPPLSTREAA